MLNRKFAAVAIATAIMFGTSACNFISPVASREIYTPGDGTSIDFGDVAARNLFILVAPGGQNGLFGSFINQGTSATAFEIEIAGQKFQYNLQAGEKLDLGFNGNNALAISGFDQIAGSLADAAFTNNSTSVKDTIPVLDSTFAEYAPLANSLGVIAQTEPPK